MRLLVIGDEARFRKYTPDLPIVSQVESVVVDRGTPDDEIISCVPDADFIVADAISPVSKTLMDAFPSLKLIHSEGVAYNAIDVAEAKSKADQAGVTDPAVYVVFLTENHDTRFNDYGVLRPLDSAG
jgi:phosphoglycerate dehydrogenase-like enzyme